MKHRILTVDDEEGIRFLVKELFGPQGYDVLEAGSAAELRQLFKGSPPDVVLLDLSLPDSNGLALLPEVKKTWPESKIIILSGDGRPETADKAFKLDDLFFQPKPFDLGMLKTVVEVALQQKAKTNPGCTEAKT